MTLELPTDDQSTVNIAFNGNLTGITSQEPNGYQTYYLELQSEYTNRELKGKNSVGTDYFFAPTLVRNQSINNDRYTEFTIDNWNSNIATKFTSGIYNWTLYATYLTLSPTQDPFIEEEWTALQTGLLKLVVGETFALDNNVNTVRHESPNENTESYVIYKQ